MNEVEEIKQRLDIVDLIGQYVTLKKAGANYKCVCPFHQEKTPSMMVSPAKQIWKCFGCGRGGDHFKFIMEAEHLEFGDALRLLAQKAGVTLQPRTQAEHQTRDKKETLYTINNLASRVFHKILMEQPAAKSALEYLKKRGLSEATIKKFCLGFAPRKFDLREFLIKRGYSAADISKAGNPDKFFERIMFPINDVLGHTIAFTGRSLGESQPKYLNSPDTPLFSKSRTIYGLNFARVGIKDKNYVVLVEGQIDVLALHQAGVEQTVASSGTAITETQIQTLSKYTPNFLLAFDNDEAGRMTTKKVIEMLLRLDLNGKVVSFGKYKDAGELFEHDASLWTGLVKNAAEGLEWWISQEIEVVRRGGQFTATQPDIVEKETNRADPMSFIENKKKVIKAMLPILKLVEEPTRLDHYAQRLALAVGVKTDAVYAALEKIASPDTRKPAIVPNAVNVPLTNEEQLLAVALARPDLVPLYQAKFDDIVWQSEDAQRIADQIKKEYNNKTLTKTPSQFSSQVKSQVNTQAAEKIDSWQFWLSSQWGELSDELARELAEEKLSQLATKDYERRKETLAAEIRKAQEHGDLAKVKDLMKALSELAKERG